ncbi:MAG: tRNA 2-thiouridine synthesizing protein [Eubacteriaceae bacterium]|jgi:TusA-related sulfurtransferase|nr:tRNA 2-thiouridine synthesizing protein [Eubacteriaceae bacterium]MDK2904170.1 tRNA 2-thiouridine synthesizing protein [Eubacteriaceae bacterium]MDK2936826.1 tRNA 2-thiouridine synthesizing protein [Eubacteriaceae bacterium]MDK2962125.1 tRNA 2-thiouridine synthesizing protein [Eubacteriaceae bacterium]
MQTIDCLGDMCPIPVLKTKKIFKTLKSGESIKIISDHSCVLESMQSTFKKHQIRSDEVIAGVWEIFLTKV